MTAQFETSHGAWTFVAPISNLKLSKAINREIHILSSTFVDRHRLERVSRRLGFPEPLSQLCSDNSHLTSFFDPERGSTYGIVRMTGTPSEIREQCLTKLNDELAVLLSSNLFRQKREYHSNIYVGGDERRGIVQHLFLNSKQARNLAKTDFRWSKSGKSVTSPVPLELDAVWADNASNLYFFKLLKILRKEIIVNESWRRTLLRVSKLIGNSFTSHDLAISFLLIMIALEMLLTEQGNNYQEQLVLRMKALLGWNPFWETHNYENKIESLYKLRCALVHDGQSDRINKHHLLFADQLLFNVLFNIIRCHKEFPSKNDLFVFAEKVRAAEVLGSKKRIRPNKFQYIGSGCPAWD